MFDRTTLTGGRDGSDPTLPGLSTHPPTHPPIHPSSGHGPFGAQDSGRLAPGRVRWIDRPIDRSTGEKPASRRRQACSSSGEVEEWNSRPGEPSCRRRYRLGVGRTATTPTIVRTAADKRDETKVFSCPLATTTIQDTHFCGGTNTYHHIMLPLALLRGGQGHPVVRGEEIFSCRSASRVCRWERPLLARALTPWRPPNCTIM